MRLLLFCSNSAGWGRSNPLAGLLSSVWPRKKSRHVIYVNHVPDNSYSTNSKPDYRLPRRFCHKATPAAPAAIDHITKLAGSGIADNSPLIPYT